MNNIVFATNGYSVDMRIVPDTAHIESYVRVIIEKDNRIVSVGFRRGKKMPGGILLIDNKVADYKYDDDTEVSAVVADLSAHADAKMRDYLP